MRTLLIFCYFLLCFSTISCKDTNTNKQVVPKSENTNDAGNIKEQTKDKLILFFGTSLTAGLGLDIEEAYPALIQNKIDSLNLPYTIVNAGLSGETTAAGKNRLQWVLNQKVDVFVLELGANDGLRGVPVEETRKNLQSIIDTVKHKNPETKIILAGMQIPPNLGVEYTAAFSNLFPQLAEKNNTNLIPFLLNNVGGVAALNQSDGIHPTAAGQKILAENVWEILYPLIRE